MLIYEQLDIVLMTIALPGVAIRLTRVPRGHGRLRLEELHLRWPWWRRPPP